MSKRFFATALAACLVTTIPAPAEAALPEKFTTYRGPLKQETDDGAVKAGTMLIKVGGTQKRIKRVVVSPEGCAEIKVSRIAIDDEGNFSYVNGPYSFSGQFVTRRKATGEYQDTGCNSGEVLHFTVRAVDDDEEAS